MKSQPVETRNFGVAQVTIWKGEYEGKETWSFTMKRKKIKRDHSVEHTDFFTLPSLNDLKVILDSMLVSKVYNKVVETRQPPREQHPDEPPAESYDGDVPF